jgi:tRNA threonylcarbamoyladenosine biosynthesis protein TsaE
MKTWYWKNCTEEQLPAQLKTWASEVKLSNTILFLEGEMGAGKSTWVRALLSAVAPGQLSKGSPTFPIVTEYRAGAGYPIYHIDLYRIRDASELMDAGIENQIEDEGALVCVEWASLFEGEFAYFFETKRKHRKHVYRVTISSASSENENERDFFIEEFAAL